MSGYRKIHHEHHGKVHGEEANMVRCRWCGAINNTSLRSKGDGWGGNFTKTDTGATATKLYYDVVGAGCWHCGSSNGW